MPLDRFLLPMALCADAVAKDGALVGDPTEGALVVLAAKGGVDPDLTRERYPRIAEVPFDAAYKFMATFHEMKDEEGQDVVRAYVKGAPDQLLARASTPSHRTAAPCRSTQVRDRTWRRTSASAPRACGSWQPPSATSTRRNSTPRRTSCRSSATSTLLALVGIVDPPRPEAKLAIEKAHAAGIQVRMITATTPSRPRRLPASLASPAAPSPARNSRRWTTRPSIARSTRSASSPAWRPEDKVHLVDILKRKGHVVAMTGDGVNDAPALKKADIGVAMGITGTEVSKEAAVMILTDDNFATIVRAVELGRALYDNLVRYIRYQMGQLFGFIATFLGASIFCIAEGIPFLPLQTLWVNFTVTVFLAVGLGYGKARDDLMLDAPRPPTCRSSAGGCSSGW